MAGHVRILMKNTGGVAVATFPVDKGMPVYAGETEIAGVPGGAAEIVIEFEDIAGSSTGALLPTGRHYVTCDRCRGHPDRQRDAGGRAAGVRCRGEWR